ncbi:22729_t:CDS:1, partial [Racocetra persica]
QIHPQPTLSGSHTPSKTTQTGSTIDSDSKGEEEEELVKTSNGNHHNGGESSEAESGSVTYDQKKTRRRK